jgi:mannose-6-phosphate isomerase-like protein (cupin superfamily)
MVTDSLDISAPRARTLDLRAGAGDRRTLLAGPPQTAGMRSGVVVLGAGESVGRHSTGSREELIVVLEGRGEVQAEGSAALAVEVGTAAYVPPATAHDVANRGEAPLRYVYVVAEACGPGSVR